MSKRELKETKDKTLPKFTLGEGKTIAEVGSFDDGFLVGRLTRFVFDAPIHCEEGSDVSGSVSVRRHDRIQPQDGRSSQEDGVDE